MYENGLKNYSYSKYITELYQPLLLREPDPKGLKYWVQKNINGMSIEKIILWIVTNIKHEKQNHSIK